MTPPTVLNPPFSTKAVSGSVLCVSAEDKRTGSWPDRLVQEPSDGLKSRGLEIHDWRLAKAGRTRDNSGCQTLLSAVVLKAV